MTNRSTNPPGRKPAYERGKAKGTTPTTRRISRPVEAKPPQRRDMFGFYFIGGATLFILLFGAAVFFARSQPAAGIATSTPLPVAAATNTPVVVEGTIPRDVEGTPFPNFTPPPSPTWTHPDALNSGEFAAGGAVSSIVGTPGPDGMPQTLPPGLPQAVMALSNVAVDFGSITAGQVHTSTITVANPSAVDLVIYSVHTDCACLTASVEAATLPPGTRTRLNIIYQPELDANQGHVVHGIGVVSTYGQSPLTEIIVTADLPLGVASKLRE